jgi:hypothetical protein
MLNVLVYRRVVTTDLGGLFSAPDEKDVCRIRSAETQFHSRHKHRLNTRCSVNNEPWNYCFTNKYKC